SRLAIAAFSLFSLQLSSPAQAQYWYWWCDASNTGYPWVRTCATPWRLVTPNSQRPGAQPPSDQPNLPAPGNLDSSAGPGSGLAQPTQLLAKPLSSSPSSTFQDGQADRQVWEAWFNSQSGDYRAGADYWAGHRSLRNPGSCTASPPSTSASWTAGCLAAQKKLTSSDTRRKAEPEYRLGWNNPSPLTSLPTVTENARMLAAQSEVQAPNTTEVSPTPSVSQPPPPQLPSPAAPSEPIPATSHSSTEDNAPIQPQPSNNDWTIAATVVFIGAGGWIAHKIVKHNVEKRREGTALQIVTAEIEHNASNLHVKRLQTVSSDQYGTIFLDQWNKEKGYYIQTRIRPALRASGLDEMYGSLAVTIETMIELAAQRPIPPAPVTLGQYVSNPEIFDLRMDPIDYERHCALQLEKAGWSTRLTPITGDQGADVIANRAGKVLVLQCKLYSTPVGNDAVQQVVAAKQFQSADLAAVVSNQSFTNSARQLAIVTSVHLLHHEQLSSFIG
ncbi:MAG TPA: restriction endonuclease, partial [Stellaceae bacterium]|nr:restriction endonuclease [Stellaceae bacterium]